MKFFFFFAQLYILLFSLSPLLSLRWKHSYIKKLIEDANVTEDTVKLLQYCCWENPHLSRTVLSELLWQIGFAYTHELRHHTDLLLTILLMEDSWQTHRVHNALKGKFVLSRETLKLVPR